VTGIRISRSQTLLSVSLRTSSGLLRVLLCRAYVSILTKLKRYRLRIRIVVNRWINIGVNLERIIFV
jgi:hypothetical protein